MEPTGRIKFLNITNEEEWLAKRKNYVTSTEASALFNCNPYKTYYELWHIKRGIIEEAKVDNKFIKFGKIIEEPVCQMIQYEHPDWFITPFNVFAYDDYNKMGSSFDRVIHMENKVGLLEVKSISYKQYKKDFIEHVDTDIEAPPHYEIQMQVELECAERYDFCLMAIFILDTRELKYIFRGRDEQMGGQIREAINEFWNMSVAPEPDYSRDAGLIARLCPKLDPNKSMDATENAEVCLLAAQYKSSKELIKQEEINAEKSYNKLLVLLGDIRYAWTNEFKITASDVKASEGKVITQEMVGTVTGKRNGYKKLTITGVKG